MTIDCHVHISAFTPGHGRMSQQLQDHLAFRFMRWRMGVRGADEFAERRLADVLFHLLDTAPELDAVALLAFDAVHDADGRLDAARTHLYVTNDYVIELARRHPKILFGASVHPYRRDAVAEIDRCVAAGAVLLKWLPIVQNFDPADDRCIPVYEALAHHGLPLLSHTGSEHALPNLRSDVADPKLLEPALRRGVRVIMAHCGSRVLPWEVDYVPTFMQLAREYEHCYGDTSALNSMNRWYALQAVMKDPLVQQKLVHGSDWPIPSIAPPQYVGLGEAARMNLKEPNGLRRDVLIKQRLGLDDAYWSRASQILMVPASKQPIGLSR